MAGYFHYAKPGFSSQQLVWVLLMAELQYWSKCLQEVYWNTADRPLLSHKEQGLFFMLAKSQWCPFKDSVPVPVPVLPWPPHSILAFWEVSWPTMNLTISGVTSLVLCWVPGRAHIYHSSIKNNLKNNKMIVNDTRRSSPIVTVPDWYAKIKQTVNLSRLMAGLQRGNPLFGEKASALPEGAQVCLWSVWEFLCFRTR